MDVVGASGIKGGGATLLITRVSGSDREDTTIYWFAEPEQEVLTML